jgi:hypothetical protein
MLTAKHTSLVAKQLAEMGELRPGFLDSDAANIKGPSKNYRIENVKRRSKKKTFIVLERKSGLLKVVKA